MGQMCDTDADGGGDGVGADMNGWNVTFNHRLLPAMLPTVQQQTATLCCRLQV